MTTARKLTPAIIGKTKRSEIRSEIADHIEQFLQRGGKIHELPVLVRDRDDLTFSTWGNGITQAGQLLRENDPKKFTKRGKNKNDDSCD